MTKGKNIKKLVLQRLGDETGATAIEYGLIAAAIGASLITVLYLAGTTLENYFDTLLGYLRSR
jgi:Flp pilus assembly pilin Flp